jgi:hypothetical protein
MITQVHVTHGPSLLRDTALAAIPASAAIGQERFAKTWRKSLAGLMCEALVHDAWSQYVAPAAAEVDNARRWVRFRTNGSTRACWGNRIAKTELDKGHENDLRERCRNANRAISKPSHG